MKFIIKEKTINDFLLILLKKSSFGISEIWFIGSRANNKDVKPTSDWDFIVCAEKGVLPLLTKNDELKEKAASLNIDLLVETDDHFSSPWESKSISKKSLKCSKLSKNEARYWGAKLRKMSDEEKAYLSEWDKYAIKHGADDSIDVSCWQKAKKIWPTDK